MRYFDLLQVKYEGFANVVKNKVSQVLAGYDVTFGNNTIFGQMINVMLSVVQNILLYIEDALTEQNKTTAQRKTSINGLAQLSGYSPSFGKAAGCNVTMKYIPTNEQNPTVNIPNHTQLICTQNGLIYNIILPQESIFVSLDKDISDKYLYAVEGRFESQTFTATGGQLYSKNLNVIGNLDLDYFNLYVNGVKWERVESLYDMGPNDNQYIIRTGLTRGVDLFFGNGQHGRVIENGDIVGVEYLLHTGYSGNIEVNAKCVFAFKETLKNNIGEEVNGNNIFLLTADTTNHVSCGTNAESLLQVKEMIGYNSRSFCLSDPKNYKVYINRFSFCGYNRTWCEEGSLVVNSLIMENYSTKVKNGSDYFNLDESDFILSDAQKESIINSITNSGQQLAGSVFNIFDPALCKYALYLYITLRDTAYDRSSIESQIRNLIGEFFSNIQSDIFIPKSDIIQLIKNEIPEIDSVDAYFLSEKNERALKNGYYKIPTKTYNYKTQKYEKSEEIVYLYPGEDPGLGLDEHGNIYLDNDNEFPILKGGWTYLSKDDDNSWEKTEGSISDPLITVFK